MATLYKLATSNAFNTNLSGNIGSGDASITLTTTTGLQFPGIIVVDRVNSNNVATPPVREYISYTGISTNTLTGCARGLGGSVAQAHTSGAVVEECISVDHYNNIITTLLNAFTSVGALDTTKVVDLSSVQTLTNKILTGNTAVNLISGSGTLTLNTTGTVTVPNATDTLVGKATTDTLTNKRRTRRVVITTQSATPTINTDNTDVAAITGLAQAVTSFTTNLTGTPVAGDLLEIQITDNATPRALTFGASFESSGTVSLPTTTVTSTLLRIGFEWNPTTSKWSCIAIA